MYIKQIKISNFRNFAAAELTPNQSLNLIHGENGAGKSSLLEALYVLGYGRSFRTSKPNTFVQNDLNTASVFCVFNDGTQDVQFGFSRDKQDGFMFSVNGDKTQKIVDVARLLPVQIFTPQSSDLILGAPLERRRYIDWLLFHVEQSYSRTVAQYQHCLKQRNALLKSSAAMAPANFDEQDVWKHQLISLGDRITAVRKDYIKRLNSEVSSIYQSFNPEINIRLRYNQGWEQGITLEQAYSKKIERDLFLGSCTSGPHKADIQFFVNDEVASEYLSRGQLRMLVSILLLAEVKLLKQITGKSSIFLIDDIAAELDEQARYQFLKQVIQQETQVFVTAIQKGQLAFTENYNNKKVFHVKHGHVNEE